jgi:hypothetical protein
MNEHNRALEYTISFLSLPAYRSPAAKAFGDGTQAGL